MKVVFFIIGIFLKRKRDKWEEQGRALWGEWGKEDEGDLLKIEGVESSDGLKKQEGESNLDKGGQGGYRREKWQYN